MAALPLTCLPLAKLMGASIRLSCHSFCSFPSIFASAFSPPLPLHLHFTRYFCMVSWVIIFYPVHSLMTDCIAADAPSTDLSLFMWFFLWYGGGSLWMSKLGLVSCPHSLPVCLSVVVLNCFVVVRAVSTTGRRVWGCGVILTLPI